MRFFELSAVFLAGSAIVEAIPTKGGGALPTDMAEIIARYRKYADTTLANSKTSCNKKKVVVRKEWFAVHSLRPFPR